MAEYGATSEYDVAVVGGGMVGASFALALAPTPLKVLLIESIAPASREHPSFDERTTALGNASRRIFQGLGVWDQIAPHASSIGAIHVSNAGRFGFARLEARAQGVEAFGYVAPNRVIGAALWDRLAEFPHIERRVPARLDAIDIGAERVDLTLHAEGRELERLSARLVVAADGAESQVRRAAGIDARVKDYDQVAIVANVSADRPHDGTAYERFTNAGPIALLPLAGGSYTAVWARSPERAEETLRLGDGAFIDELQRQFGWRAGRFVRAGRRGSYRLKLTRADAIAGTRSVLIGNAAQALHPVAGQGFNLGLRDAAVLAEVLADARSADPGSPQVLARFARERAVDRRGVVGFTDGLVRLFGDSRQAVGFARNVGLLLFDLAPPAKSALARVSTGFGGRTPRLARGLKLT
ncbi:MAG TPA: 2-octaprenyl-6-methoxyphenyl hydroxylase [Steroidobacteraceae bacterium]|nr:2-octaprenyl-6-methoxyphenyl hydroxylase [Steroidobacteraceae bacterium]